MARGWLVNTKVLGKLMYDGNEMGDRKSSEGTADYNIPFDGVTTEAAERRWMSRDTVYRQDIGHEGIFALSSTSCVIKYHLGCKVQTSKIDNMPAKSISDILWSQPARKRHKSRRRRQTFTDNYVSSGLGRYMLANLITWDGKYKNQRWWSRLEPSCLLRPWHQTCIKLSNVGPYLPIPYGIDGG